MLQCQDRAISFALSAISTSILHHLIDRTAQQWDCLLTWTIFNQSYFWLQKRKLSIKTWLFCPQMMGFVFEMTLMMVTVGCADPEVSGCRSSKRNFCLCEVSMQGSSERGSPGPLLKFFGREIRGFCSPGRNLWRNRCYAVIGKQF